MEKLCNRCNDKLELEKFGRKKDGHLGRRPQCLVCTAEMSREGRGAAAKEKPPKPPKAADIRFDLSEDRKVALGSSQRFVITCALNNSPVDQDIWLALKQYAKYKNAEIIVLPVRYKNPTNRVEGRVVDEGAWWPKEVLPYLTDELLALHEQLWVMGHLPIQATAKNPLTGLDSITRGNSGIFGHPQLAMKMVATPQHKLPKILYTTGSVSVPNYSDSKAGVQADFNHGMGAVVVELDGPRFHIRPLVGDDEGGFYDIDRYYSRRGSRKSTGALALVTGDEHAVFADPQCKAATYLNEDSLVATLKPETIVRHDVFDGFAISHHHKGNPTTMLAKYLSGHNLLARELQLTVDHIDETTPPNTKNLIVSSNHHDHLLQWMKSTNPMATDPANLEIWIDLWHMLRPTIKMRPGGASCGNPMALWMAPQMKSDTEFLRGDSGRTIGGIAIGMHGHNGVNGSRGSLQQFSRIGVRTITGHSHSAGIIRGSWAVGTSSLYKLEYTKGLSSWIHAHTAIHPNGKRQTFIVVDGHWRLS